MEEIESFPRSAKARYEDELEYRFDVFGGVARSCLATDTQFVNAQQVSLKRNALCVDLMTGHRARFPRQHCDELSHRLFHCYRTSEIRKSEFFMTWTLKTASPYVTQLLDKRVNLTHPVERAYFQLKSASTPTIAAFLQSLVVGRMLAELENGVKLVANSLEDSIDDAENDLTLSIQPSATTMTRLSSQFSGPTWLGNEFEWIDALYLIKTEEVRACESWRNLEAVVLMVPTIFGYSVPGKRLYSLLKRLNLVENAPQRVALVFCVAETQADDLDKQWFKWGRGLDGESPVTVVDGITTEMATALKALSVHTLHDLRVLPDQSPQNEEQAQLFEQAHALMSALNNEAVMYGTASYAMLDQIPQFVWGIKE